jgi:hypothetical protein
MWQFGTGNRKFRWHARGYPDVERKNKVILPHLPLELWAPCKARWVWAGAVIFASATCSLQFAKAAAVTLSQQEKNNSADEQRGRVNISELELELIQTQMAQKLMLLVEEHARIRFYLYSGKFILAATYLLRVAVDGLSFAAGASALTHVYTAGAMLGAMALFAPPQPNEAMVRIAPRLVPQPNDKQQNSAGPKLYSFGVDSRFETARSTSAFIFCALAVPEA